MSGEDTLSSLATGQACPDTSELRSEQGFRSFYREALPRVFGYLLQRCGGDRAVAEDLTQASFLAAESEIKRGAAIEDPMRWIYGIARHELLDHYRREAREERRVRAARQSAELADELLEAAEVDRDRVSAALGAVAPMQRAALLLCYVDGYSMAEAATLLGRSVEAIESLLARGRQGFKRAYLEDRS